MTNQGGLEPALHAVRGAGLLEPMQVIVWDKRLPTQPSLRDQVEYVLLGRLQA